MIVLNNYYLGDLHITFFMRFSNQIIEICHVSVICVDGSVVGHFVADVSRSRHRRSALVDRAQNNRTHVQV